jgi:hypothetical protein
MKSFLPNPRNPIPVGTVHPVIDYFVSWLTFAEVYTMYHHFIVLHDVDHVDASGAPRQENGEACCIAEFAGTLQDSMEMVRQSMPLPTLLYHKAFFQVVPLADYGDQFVYRVRMIIDLVYNKTNV